MKRAAHYRDFGTSPVGTSLEGGIPASLRVSFGWKVQLRPFLLAQTGSAQSSAKRYRQVTENAMEPISPELVLVDPELARVARMYGAPVRDRARDGDAARDDRRAEQSPEARGEAVPRVALASIVKPALAASVLLNLFVLGSLVGMNVDRVTAALTTDSAIPWAGGAEVRAAGSDTRKPASNQPTLSANAEIEHTVLQLLQSARREVMPRTLFAPDTGLLRNNVSVGCARATGGRRYTCLVRAGGALSQPLLRATYRSSRGGARVTWSTVRRQESGWTPRDLGRAR
jgi:hypothetical protein